MAWLWLIFAISPYIAVPVAVIYIIRMLRTAPPGSCTSVRIPGGSVSYYQPREDGVESPVGNYAGGHVTHDFKSFQCNTLEKLVNDLHRDVPRAKGKTIERSAYHGYHWILDNWPRYRNLDEDIIYGFLLDEAKRAAIRARIFGFPRPGMRRKGG
jgi:hypothetical protein